MKIYAAIDAFGRIIATNDEPFEARDAKEYLTFVPERNFPTVERPGAFGYVARALDLQPTESTVIYGTKVAEAAPVYRDYGHYDAWIAVLDELKKGPQAPYVHGGPGIDEARRQIQFLVSLAQDGERLRALFAASLKPEDYQKFHDAAEAVCNKPNTIDAFRAGVDAGIEATSK